MDKTQNSAKSFFSETVGSETLSVFLVVALLFIISFSAFKIFEKSPGVQKIRQVTFVENKVIEGVTKLVGSPLPERPVVYLINDAALLASSQQFFSSASNGDFLLIFPSLKQALVYSPLQNKIVNSGPITVDAQGNTAVASQ